MHKTRVLFLAESLNVGGAEKALVSLLPLLDYSKFDITLMLISETGGFIPDAKTIPGLRVKHIVKPRSSKMLSLINAFIVKSYYQWLPHRFIGNSLCRGYDVVVAFTEGYLTKWISASSTNCRKIAWVHTDMVENDWPVITGVFPNFEAEKTAYQKYDSVVGVSELVSQGMKTKFGLKNVSTIYNILDPNILQKAKEPVDYQPTNKLNIVSVGRIEKVKGYDNLIEAIGVLVNKQGLDISLCLVGDGSQRGYLEAKANALNISERVQFVGSQVNPYPYVEKSDIYICSSLQEGFNIAILEAMILGKPIISTNSAGPREILDGGKYGVLVENNVEEIANAIRDLYNQPVYLQKYSELSLQRSIYFNTGNQLSRIERLLHI